MNAPITYIDRHGQPQCATCQGILPASQEMAQKLTDLRNDIDLALDCIGIFGGVPIPVKQAINRNAAWVQTKLAATHIVHDMARTGAEGEAN